MLTDCHGGKFTVLTEIETPEKKLKHLPIECKVANLLYRFSVLKEGYAIVDEGRLTLQRSMWRLRCGCTRSIHVSTLVRVARVPISLNCVISFAGRSS